METSADGSRPPPLSRRRRGFPRRSGKFPRRPAPFVQFDESGRERETRELTRLTSAPARARVLGQRSARARDIVLFPSAHARARIARDNRDFPHTRLPLYLRERGACTRGAPLCSPLRYI